MSSTVAPDRRSTSRAGLPAGLAVSRGPLVVVLPRRWPPGGSRWITLLLVTALSLLLPLLVGAALGEGLGER